MYIKKEFFEDPAACWRCKGSGRVKNNIRKIKFKELKGSARLWIRPILKDEKGVKKRERERIEAAKVSVKKTIA